MIPKEDAEGDVGQQGFVRPVTLIWLGVQTLVAITGFLMIHTLDRLNQTIDTAMTMLIAHERRISRLEGIEKGAKPRTNGGQ